MGPTSGIRRILCAKCVHIGVCALMCLSGPWPDIIYICTHTHTYISRYPVLSLTDIVRPSSETKSATTVKLSLRREIYIRPRTSPQFLRRADSTTSCSVRSLLSLSLFFTRTRYSSALVRLCVSVGSLGAFVRGRFPLPVTIFTPFLVPSNEALLYRILSLPLIAFLRYYSRDIRYLACLRAYNTTSAFSLSLSLFRSLSLSLSPPPSVSLFLYLSLPSFATVPSILTYLPSVSLAPGHSTLSCVSCGTTCSERPLAPNSSNHHRLSLFSRRLGRVGEEWRR